MFFYACDISITVIKIQNVPSGKWNNQKKVYFLAIIPNVLQVSTGILKDNTQLYLN